LRAAGFGGKLSGMTRSQRILIGMAVFAVLVVGYVYFFGSATVLTVMSRRMGHKYPYIEIIPVALSDTSVASVPVKREKAFGYEFEVPWDDLDESQTVAGEKAARFKSRSDRWTLGIMQGGPKELVQSLTTKPNNSAALYGDALKSDFALRQAIYGTTPSQIKLWTPRNVAVRDMSYLIMKGIMMTSGSETGMFEVASGAMKGYQLGDPALSKKVNVEISDDVGEISFIFQQDEYGRITQAELNRVIQSVRRVETAAK
jgi:hypothetical protein